MQISAERFRHVKGTMAALERDRQPFWSLWRELANYYLPRRYIWLQTDNERRARDAKNPYILDGTGTAAARTLASGMMNGVTSPTRPWFKLRINNHDQDAATPVRAWLDEVQRRMLLVMSESNFYNALAVLYLDLVVFGTAAMLIYEDQESVIRCYNPCLGEFYVSQSDRLQVCTFAREFTYNIHQLAMRFGKENLPDTEKALLGNDTGGAFQTRQVYHLIEPNDDGQEPKVPKGMKYREYYWLKSSNAKLGNEILSVKGFRELPGLFPRWELAGNDAYGTSPAMDALGDVIQLQHETKKKAQGLDKMISPPVVADIQLQHRPTALMPNGVTFVAGANSIGIKPAYEVRLPLGELTLDIKDVQVRIRETFHNPLFMMISQLETVRSATEIDARREEKLVLLGSVLERFENEALDPAIRRVFGIMGRFGLLPEAPPELADADIEIQYVSILSVAQRAVGVVPTERWLGLIGQVAPIYPKALNLPNFENLLLDYGRDIGVSQRGMRSPDEIKAMSEEMDKQRAAQEAAATGTALVESGKLLSETEVGGGQNALQHIIGG